MNKKLQIYLARAMAAAVLAGTTVVAQATTLEDLGLSASNASELEGQLRSPGASPGVAFGSPIGYGTGYTEFFAGIGGQTVDAPPGAEIEDLDGSMSLGVGIGDPTDWVALEVSTTIISLQDSFGEDGNLNAKLHHAFEGRYGIAVGVENTGTWGAAKDTDPSYYVAITKALDLFPAELAKFRLSLTAGAGDNRFTKPEDPDSISGFGAVALSYGQRFSVIGDWTGRDANVGVSFLPFQGIPLVVTLGAINLTERYEQKTEFAGGIGYTFRL